MIVMLTLITNLVEGNNFGVEVNGCQEADRKQQEEARGSASNLHFGGQCQTTMGELERYTGVCVIACEDVPL